MRLTCKAALAGAACFALAAAAAAPVLAQDAAPAPDPRFTVTELAQGLESPWALALLPDGSILITEKPGRFRIVRNGQLAAEPIANAPADLFFGGQGGLLDLALHPQFASNRLVYFTYSAGAETDNATTVGRGTLNTAGTALENIETVFAAGPNKHTPIHFGGRMAFLPDQSFLLTVGDGFVTREDAQRTNSDLGKILRINDDGSIPTDNPFANVEGARPEIWTVGHRNLQGLAVDPATGAVWETEHGPWGGDELNLIERGKNYGWPVITWGRDYNGAAISPFREYEGMEQPKVNWTPVIAASGLAVYHGAMFPDWDGDILAGGLGAGAVVRVEVDASGNATEAERMLAAEIGGRVRDVRVGPDGAIYVLTDAAPFEGNPTGGRLLRVTAAR